jgi:hypothetical protein
MSDYITGLRADLVDAAARHGRRRRLRRVPAALNSRAWRPATALGVAAVAASVVAVVIAVSTLAPPHPNPGRLQIVAEVRLDGQPQDAVLAGGSLWVSDFSGAVVRVDPAGRRVVERIPVGGDSRAIVAGDGGVWVTSTNEDGDGSHLSRIDPHTGRVVDRVPVDGYVTSIADAAGGIWLVDQHRARLDRIDPASHAPTARVRFPRAVEVTAAGDTLWARGGDGTVVAVDGELGRIVQRLRGVAFSPEPDAPNALAAADADEAWVASWNTGAVLQIRAGRVVRQVAVGAAPGPVARTDDTVWVASRDDAHHRYRLSRIDPARGTITGTIELGNHAPRALVPAGSGLWVIAADGTALLVQH